MVIGIFYVCVQLNDLLILPLSDPGYFRQLTFRGGALTPPLPLGSQKLFCQSSPYHTCAFYQVFKTCFN